MFGGGNPLRFLLLSAYTGSVGRIRMKASCLQSKFESQSSRKRQKLLSENESPGKSKKLGEELLRSESNLAGGEMDEALANILHDHNYVSDEEKGTFITCGYLQRILTNVQHDHNYVGPIANAAIITNRIELSGWYDGVKTKPDDHESCVTIEEIYHGVTNTFHAYDATLEDIIKKGTHKSTSSNSEETRNIVEDGTKSCVRETKLNSDAYVVMLFEHTMKQDMDTLTSLCSSETGNIVENRSIWPSSKTVSDIDTTADITERTIKQEKDYDEYDPYAITETLSMFDDLVPEYNVKIEQCVSEWNDNCDRCKEQNTVYTDTKPDLLIIQKDCSMALECSNNERCKYCLEQFETSELKVKHECTTCNLAPILIVNVDKLRLFSKEETKVTKDHKLAYWNYTFCKYCNTGFETNTLKLKHECISECSPQLVVQLLRQNISFRLQRKQGNGSRTLKCNKPDCSVFQCYHCGYQFSHKSNIRLHLLRYRQQRKKYKCPKCNFTAYSKTTLRMHGKTMHTIANKDFHCDYCLSAYFTKSNLQDHMLRKHPEINYLVTCKVHKCKNCPFQTTYKRHLRDHEMKHSDMYPHQCALCGYRSKRKTHVTRHIESHVVMDVDSPQQYNSSIKRSSKIEQFCSICNKLFASKKHFYSHIVIHHSENESMMKLVTSKIYKCSYCDQKRLFMKLIVEHENVHHKRQLVNKK
ncbi:unnamed protein product [Acanthoscelides obtectus]|uniref:C2H2-type domain-containing protein n=1 Tax=Acanthoscelides obtectus TaxID=200917 RepID=A0A9P0QAE3_ACAOB|nr:unnamed protein product [Acanthoscelides obtectus]CAK1630775.1 Zinc finger protein with KRAB and SCAN domains 3 [Acanthoscelides obtectus]